ncbi:MAG: hypothetical protein ACYS14_09365, partial [Planctomycetota bacterium]
MRRPALPRHFRGCRIKRCGVYLLLFALLASVSFAEAEEPTAKDVLQDSAAKEEKAVEEPKAEPAKPSKPKSLGPVDDFDRGVPATCVTGFIDAADKGDFERAAEYLDLRYLPYGMSSEQGPELSRKLKIVLDRALWIDPGLLSAEPEGHTDDGLWGARDLIGKIEVEDRTVNLLLQRVPRDDGVMIWKVSSATVYQIPELYKTYGYGAVGERLARLFPSYEFLGLQVWQWIMAFGILFGAYLIAYIPTKAIAIVLRRRKTDISTKMARFVAGPIRLLVAILIAQANLEIIRPSMKARAIM